MVRPVEEPKETWKDVNLNPELSVDKKGCERFVEGIRGYFHGRPQGH